MIEYSGEEYKMLILQLNANKNKKLMLIGSLVSAVIGFIVGIVIDDDMYFNFVLAFAAALATYYIMKKNITDNAKKVNFMRDIVRVEQTITEYKIHEKVVRKSGVINEGEYSYKDISYVKQDKLNFYLYLNNEAALVVGKSKLKNVDEFKNILLKHEFIKPKKERA